MPSAAWPIEPLHHRGVGGDDRDRPGPAPSSPPLRSSTPTTRNGTFLMRIDLRRPRRPRGTERRPPSCRAPPPWSPAVTSASVKKLALRDVPGADERPIDVDSLKICVPQFSSPGDDLRRRCALAADVGHRRTLGADRRGVLGRQRRLPGEHPCARLRRRAREDHQEVRSERRRSCAWIERDAPEADRDHRDHAGDADDDPEHGQRRAQLVAQDRRRPTLTMFADPHAADAHDGALRPRSCRRCERRARSSASGPIRDDPAVAEHDLAPGELRDVGLVGDHDDRLPGSFSSWRIAMISSEVRESRLPGRLVGQQDGRIGRPARERSPPAAAGRRRAATDGGSSRPARPTRASALARPLVALGAAERAVAVQQRQLDVLERRGARQQVEALEHEADLRVADLGALRRRRAPRRRCRRGGSEPEVGRSRQPRMFMSVDLPEPDGPITATNSPAPIVRSTPSSARTSTSPVR